MGDLHARLPQQTGSLPDQRPSSPSLAEPSNPDPSAIPANNWRLAEQTVQRIIWKIQPTRVSEERRRDVIQYVQQLIRTRLGSEVFPFGSVPLKTYLPDGDIDLTAFGLPNSEEALSSGVRAILEQEEKNKAALFEVNNVQYIHAEVDNLIGKDHLFKRSIILIKAWCYYESRILGAHHSLISTYALETLVLYIFHFFNSSLDGPLAVLYRFLDYFGKFDWDSFCISLHGPIRLTSLPEIVADPDMPETSVSDLLLTTEFLNGCAKMFSVPPRIPDNNHRSFVKKHLNIVDPLKENNNLGRSVSKGNLYRIRSAFSYGARKLGKILMLPRESMTDELNTFFMNTLDRHLDGERPDVQGKKNALETESGLESCNHLLAGDYQQSSMEAKNECSEECDAISSICLTGDAEEPDISGASDSRDANKTGLSSTCTELNIPSSKAPHAPHLFFCQGNGKIVVPCSSDVYDPAPDVYDLADLSGEDERHSNNLLFAQQSQEFSIEGPIPLGNSSFLPRVINKQLWDASRQHTVFQHANGVIQSLPFYPVHNYYQMNPAFVSGSYGMEDAPKPRGTGTYFPNMNYQAYKDRQLPGRGRNQFPPTYGLRNRNNGRPVTPPGSYSMDTVLRETPQQAQLPLLSGNGHEKSGSSASWSSSHASSILVKTAPLVNEISSTVDGQVEFGSFGSVPPGIPNSEPGGNLESNGYHSNNSGPMMSPSMVQRAGVKSNHGRLTKAYHLRDEDEFPPLSGKGHQHASANTDVNRTAWEIRK